jgi:hypothetical protein
MAGFRRIYSRIVLWSRLMTFAARRAPADSLASLALLILAAVALQGCGQSSSREEEFVKNNAKSQPKEPVGKFSGRVTVDGVFQVGRDDGLFVFLTDSQHLDKPHKYSTCCKEDGSFEFMTYVPGDGVPPGKYVVGFVQLHSSKKARGFNAGDGAVSFKGPDALKNLYNDADKNKDIKEFVVEVTEPGRTDYEFNLAVAGKDAGVPGPHAVKSLADVPGGSTDF